MDEHGDASFARAPEPGDLVRVCRALNDAGARYVLIGVVPVPIASPATLIRTNNTHRPQDAIDREFLEGVLRDRRR